MATERERRIAENEAIFRVANERMASWEEQHEADEVELYFCECANPDCREKVPLRKPDYERVRGNSRHFFVVPGHDVPDVETVIETHEDWILIEKGAAAGDLVEASDPRTP